MFHDVSSSINYAVKKQTGKTPIEHVLTKQQIATYESKKKKLNPCEKRYHVMTALKQALNSARPRGGIIDEGNSIYLFDIGVNVSHAQAEIFNYLKIENEMIANGSAPSHEMTVEWLEKCADKFQDCSERFAASRGFTILDEKSLTQAEQVTMLPSQADKEFAQLQASTEE